MFSLLRRRFPVFSLAFLLPLLALVLPSAVPQATAQVPPPVKCTLLGDGRLLTGPPATLRFDRFFGNVTVFDFPGNFGQGTWEHFTAWRAGQSGVCTLRDKIISERCFENERTGLGDPGLTSLCAREQNRLCARDHFDGVVFNASCTD